MKSILMCMAVPLLLGTSGWSQELTYTYIDLGINKVGEPRNNTVYDFSLPLYNGMEQDIKNQVLFRVNDRGRVAGWVERGIMGVGVVPIAATWFYDTKSHELEFQELSELPDASNPFKSWATGISERGVIAGMTATPHAIFGDNFLANAAVWKQDGVGWSQLDLALGQNRDEGGESGALDIIDIAVDGQYHYAVCGGVDRPRCTNDDGSSLQGLRSFRFTSNDASSEDVIEKGDSLRYQYATSFLDENSNDPDRFTVGPGIYASDPADPCIATVFPSACCHSKRSRSYLLDFNTLDDVNMRYLEENTICFEYYPSWDIKSDFECDAMSGHSVGHLRENLESNENGEGPCFLRATHRATWASFPEILPLLPVIDSGDGDAEEQHTRAQGIGTGHEGTLQAAGFSSKDGTKGNTAWQKAVLWNQHSGGIWEGIDLQGLLERGGIDISGLDVELNPGTLELITAHDVNRKGWIVGIARVETRSSSVEFTRPFLLIPDTCPLPPCPGDINGDGVVDGIDISILLTNWASSLIDTDFNCDGETDAEDLVILLSNWGPC